MHQVFTNSRWAAFHAPVMTVDFKLHPEFCRNDTDKWAATDFDKAITDLDKAQTPSPSLNPKMTFTIFLRNLV